MRNAVMSGFARATVVIEASHTSGARMQARLALEHGRPVFLMRSLLQHDWARALRSYPVSTSSDAADEIVEHLDRLYSGGSHADHASVRAPVALTVDEAAGTYERAMRSPLPAGVGVCSICHTFINPVLRALLPLQSRGSSTSTPSSRSRTASTSGRCTRRSGEYKDGVRRGEELRHASAGRDSVAVPRGPRSLASRAPPKRSGQSSISPPPFPRARAPATNSAGTSAGSSAPGARSPPTGTSACSVPRQTAPKAASSTQSATR